MTVVRAGLRAESIRFSLILPILFLASGFARAGSIIEEERVAPAEGPAAVSPVIPDVGLQGFCLNEPPSDVAGLLAITPVGPAVSPMVLLATIGDDSPDPLAELRLLSLLSASPTAFSAFPSDVERSRPLFEESVLPSSAWSALLFPESGESEISMLLRGAVSPGSPQRDARAERLMAEVLREEERTRFGVLHALATVFALVLGLRTGMWMIRRRADRKLSSKRQQKKKKRPSRRERLVRLLAELQGGRSISSRDGARSSRGRSGSSRGRSGSSRGRGGSSRGGSGSSGRRSGRR